MRGVIRIAVVVALATLSFLAWGPLTRPQVSSDAPLYETLARNIASGRGYVAPDVVAVSVPQQPGKDVPSTIRAPGYPLFLALFFRLHLGETAVLIAQMLLFVATCGLIAWESGTIAGVIAATSLATIDCGHQIMTETLFLAVIATAFVLLRHDKVLAAALLLAIAPLIRPIGVLLPFVLAVWLLLTKRKPLVVALFLIIAIAPSAAWIARNEVVGGAPVIDGASNENVLFYRAAGVLIAHGRGPMYALTAMHVDSDFYYRLVHIRPRLLAAALASMPDAEPSTYARRCMAFSAMGRRIILAHPIDAALLAISGVGRLALDEYSDVLATRIDYRNAHAIGMPVAIIVLLLAAIGTRSRDKRLVALCVVFIAYFVVLAAEPGTEPRFTSAYLPMMAALAGEGVAVLRR